MSRTNDIHSEMWEVQEFLALTPHAKLVYVWSFTNGACGMSGLYRIARASVGFQTGLYAAGDLDGALLELRQARFVFYEDGVLFVRTRIKHLRMKTIQIAKSIMKDLALIPREHPLWSAFVEEYRNVKGFSDLRTLIAVEAPADFRGSTEVQKDGLVEPNVVTPPQDSDESYRQGQGLGQRQRLSSEVTSDVGRAEADPDIAAGIAAGAVHPGLPAVMALLGGLPPDKALNLDEGAVNNCLLAHRDGDAIEVAHRVVAWALEGQMRTRSASTALHTIFDKQRTEAEVRAKQVERAGERPAYLSRSPSGKKSAAEQAAEARVIAAQRREQEERDAA